MSRRHRAYHRREPALSDLVMHHNDHRRVEASRILTSYLVSVPSGSERDRLACMETALRVDIFDEEAVSFRSLWVQFRGDLTRIFHRDTGCHLPCCCRFPRSNLYKALQEIHASSRVSA